MVLNVSEMEAKVKEATNEDPWWVFKWNVRNRLELNWTTV